MGGSQGVGEQVCGPIIGQVDWARVAFVWGWAPLRAYSVFSQ